MRRPVRVGAALLATLAVACGPADEGGERAQAGGARGVPGAAPADSAEVLAERLVESLGGEEAWKETRFLRFRWIVERDGETVASRDHAWDRYSGRYRLSFEDRERGSVFALFDVHTLASDTLAAVGDVWVGGRRLEGAARDSALERAYAIFINDSYWLLMPLKWRDPGVHLAYEGWTELPDGERYPTVHLTFDEGLGVTNDEYWGFVDPETGRMVAWRFHLEGREEKGPVIWWRDWRDVGPVTLAADRVWETGGTRIRLEELAASRTVPEGVFEPPSG